MRARGGFIGVHVRGVISLVIQSQFYLPESFNRSFVSHFVRFFALSAPGRMNAHRGGMSPSSSPLPQSTRAEPLTSEEWASLCNAQAVQLELYQSEALAAKAELMVLRLALGAADCDIPHFP